MTVILAPSSTFSRRLKAKYAMPQITLTACIWKIICRTAIRTWEDGFIHAGNLAYLSMLAIFPFFILGATLFQLVDSSLNANVLVDTVLGAMPANVIAIVEPVAHNTMAAESGWLLWVGAGVALWTISSLVESIRDIMHRAYDTCRTHGFWLSRLRSAGLILAAVLLMIGSLFVQVAISTIQQMIAAWSPELIGLLADLSLSRIISALGLFISLYLLFFTLTPACYRTRNFAKWPGAVATTVWWLAVTSAMPPLVNRAITYDLLYGSLAGIMLVLFFFWLVGLGLVMGAELNASLAQMREDNETQRNSADLLNKETVA